MTLSKRDNGGCITLSGADYEWRLHREPQWCGTKGWVGVAIAVRHVDGQREAILEWPMPQKGKSKSVPYRQRPQILPMMLEKGIATALEAGWEPMSRGRPVSVIIK